MKPHICSWRLGLLLDNALRRMIHNPDRIVTGLVGAGDTAVDIGCGPGFFSIPLARKVGASGTLVAVDVQRQMLEMVRSKAVRAGVRGQVRLHQSTPGRIGLSVRADLVLTFYMAHEVPDPGPFFREIRQMLTPTGQLLLVEPKFHVSASTFRNIVSAAEGAGLEQAGSVAVPLSRGALFRPKQPRHTKT